MRRAARTRYRVPSLTRPASVTSSLQNGWQVGRRRVCFDRTEVLTLAEVAEAEEELKALLRHGLEVVPKADD